MGLLWHIFILFTRVAIFSWGGGPASLALMQREVTSVGWLTPDEFADGVAFCNALPGPTSPRVSAFIGYQLAGVPGAVAAATGTVVPTTVLLLVMLAFFSRVKDNPAVKSMLTAVRPVVVSLLIWTAYDMARTVLSASKLGWGTAMVQGWDKLAIVAISLALLTFTRVDPVFIIIGSAVFGFFVYR
jgi:chromate transporter